MGLLLKSPEQSYQVIRENAASHSVEKMCHTLGSSRSGYYSWVRRSSDPSKRAKEDAALNQEIHAIFTEHKKRYGVPRVLEALQIKGICCGKTRVARLMRKGNLYARHRKSYRITTNSKHNLPIAPNLLNREFTALAPNRRWVTDITYIQTLRGWLYLVVILDLFSARVVGWATSNRLTSQFVVDAVRNAIKNRRPPEGLILHSDRGVQYASRKYQMLLMDNKILCSMSRKGNCWDNAPAESFFSTLKQELVGGRIYRSREEASLAIFEYIEVYYNRKRMHSKINYMTPENYEKVSLSA